MFATRVLILTLAVFVTFVVGLQLPEDIGYRWKYLNFTWETPDQYQAAVRKLEYIPRNNAIAGIKIWKDRVYLTLPRLRNGVAVTLAVTSLQPVNGNKSPLLKPYPNWQMQKLGDCNAFQFVQSMEIDPAGRMWIIDTGRNAFLEENVALCPPRLVILDLDNDGKMLLNYEFPKDVVNPLTCYLNDIVLDGTDGGYAYISNTDTLKPSIVVFSLLQKKSWSITDKSMYATAPIISVKGDQTVVAPLNIDSIALSAASKGGERQLYYAPLSSKQLFSVTTDALKGNFLDFASKVTLVGEKPSQTDGMMIDASGKLYFGLVADNQVSEWNTNKPPFTENQKRVFGDDVNLMWPDTFAIDQCGTLWVTTDKLERQYTNTIDINEFNFRVVKLTHVNYLSYQYYPDGTAPELPMIEGTSDSKDKYKPIIHTKECMR